MQIALINYQKYLKNIINIHSSTRMTPKQASNKSNEYEVYNDIRHKRKKRPKFKIRGFSESVLFT